MNRIASIGVLAIVLFGGAFWLLQSQMQSGATFSDTEVVRSSITSETVQVDISEVEGRIAIFELENMAPGDEFRGKMVVSNTGSLPILYGITSTADASELNQFLTLDVLGGTGDCSETSVPSEPIFSGGFDTTTSDVVGVQATQEGYRALAVGATEILCAQIKLPLEVGSEAQGLTTSQSFTVIAVHDIEASE